MISWFIHNHGSNKLGNWKHFDIIEKKVPRVYFYFFLSNQEYYDSKYQPIEKEQLCEEGMLFVQITIHVELNGFIAMEEENIE